jgi:DNA mismatch repair protein MutL
VYDIHRVDTYGFRGEAVSSISSISDITILSRRHEDKTGAKLSSSQNGIETAGFAGPGGTTVIVENLFYNVPARKKFLKTRRTEMRFIRETFLKAALPHPGTAFTLDVDGKRHITLGKAASPDERIEQIYGSEVLENLYFESMRDIKVDITGFFSRPGFMRSSRSMQLLYINGRPVEFKYFGYILMKAYEAIAMRGKHPAAIVFIDIEPELVDVNIHPAKREVKVFDQRYLESLVLKLAEKALNRKHSFSSELFRGEENAVRETVEISTSGGGPVRDSGSGGSLFRGREVFHTAPVSLGKAMVNEGAGLYKEFRDDESIRILGTAFGTYVLAEQGETLSVIDFHAAHERFIYDRLRENTRDTESQALAFPVMAELPLDDYRLVTENFTLLEEMGFDIDDFADNTVTVRSVPGIVKDMDVKEFLADFAESVRGEREGADFRDAMAKSAACHSAKRSGDHLSESDLEILVREVFSGDHEMRCPHGRPFIYSMNKSDFERMFSRQ